MASVTKNMDENAMADDETPRGADENADNRIEPRQPRPVAVHAPEAVGGFFTIRKKGQGYWTRMGTAGGVALIGVMIGYFLYSNLPAWGTPGKVAVAITGIICAGYALLAFWLMNKTTSVDFLIATDSEMKKVNWTSRKELIGSTKVVILFMFLIAALLFVVDLVFGYFFYFIKVLKTPPM